MKVDGACFCGQITYEAVLDTDRIVICNCTDCQSLSGSAFRTVAFTKEGAFTLLTGEMKVYVKIADSGNRRQQAFCGTCGSPIYATSDPAGPFYGLRVGTIRQRDQLVPKVHIFNRSKQHWLDQIPRSPPSRACHSVPLLKFECFLIMPPSRHGRACPGHPRVFPATATKNVDARNRSGHDVTIGWSGESAPPTQDYANLRIRTLARIIAAPCGRTGAAAPPRR